MTAEPRVRDAALVALLSKWNAELAAWADARLNTVAR